MLALAGELDLMEAGRSDAELDDELMITLQEGRGAARDEAFRTLAHRHAAAVQGFARSLLGKAEGAEDVAQEVFLRVYQARERYVPGRAPFRAWLFRIARNLALNARRDRSRRRSTVLEDADDLEESGAGPARAREQRLDAEALDDAVSRLPSGEREVIALRFKEGLSYEEIGSILGGGAAALKQKTWRALQRLRTLLGAEEEGST
jgi:RNA polymerase sigma-70 factor (ECF subfamily)